MHLAFTILLACSTGTNRETYESSQPDIPVDVLYGLCERADLNSCERLSKESKDPLDHSLAFHAICDAKRVDGCINLSILGDKTGNRIEALIGRKRACLLGRKDMCKEYLEATKDNVKPGKPIPKGILQVREKLAHFESGQPH